MVHYPGLVKKAEESDFDDELDIPIPETEIIETESPNPPFTSTTVPLNTS